MDMETNFNGWLVSGIFNVKLHFNIVFRFGICDSS